MAEEKQQVTPPIPDANGNGVLDGEDLLTQLSKEEEAGSDRTPNEAAHGVLEVLGARAFARSFGEVVMQNATPENFKAVSEKAAEGISQSLTKLGTSLKYKDEALWQEGKARLDAAEAAGVDPDLVNLKRADDQHAHDFVQTFAATFPKGVQVDAEDVPYILGHFGPVPIYIAPAKEEDPNTKGNKK